LSHIRRAEKEKERGEERGEKEREKEREKETESERNTTRKFNRSRVAGKYFAMQRRCFTVHHIPDEGDNVNARPR